MTPVVTLYFRFAGSVIQISIRMRISMAGPKTRPVIIQCRSEPILARLFEVKNSV